ncbi:MAG: ATPase domain-containing protein [Halanaerobiales bacterium]
MRKPERLSSGIEGLDKILNGGYLKKRSYLLKGGPGTGKTTIGLHFLEEGINNNDKCMFINFETTKDELIKDAKAFNFKIEQVHVLDLTPTGEYIKEDEYDIFSAEEVEQAPIIDRIINNVKKIRPDRLVFDSLSNLYYLYENKYKLRKNIISLIQYLAEHETTSIFITEDSGEMDNILQFIASGVINLEYDGYERKLNIIKYRGSSHLKDYHSLTITEDGINILSNIFYKKETKDIKSEIISSGINEIDKLLKGGLESSTNTIIMGPTGVGKTTFSISFIRNAIKNNKKALVYLFEESEDLLRKRCEEIGMSLEDNMENNNLKITTVNSLEYNPIEFSNLVRSDVDKNDIDILLLDSITGYYLSFVNKYYTKYDLLKHLHNLSNFLTNQGITVLMTNEMESITGEFKTSDLGISYLADNIVFLRYLEMNGQLNKAIGVLKKRLSDFEKTIREFEITGEGIVVGKPLTNVRGILKNDLEFLDI